MATIGVIGGGPAGIAAAIQLARSGMQPLVFEHDRPGGLLHEANLVENYPGFPDGITGPELAGRMLDHALKFNIRFVHESVTRIIFDRDTDYFAIHAADEIRVRHLIVASGTRPRKPAFPLPENTGSIHSSIREIASLTGQRIGIVGGGDAAFDYAIQLAETGNSISIFHRGIEPRCLPLLRQWSARIPAIEYRGSSPVTGLIWSSDTREIGIRIHRGPVLKHHFFNHVLLAVGREPADDFMAIPAQLSTALEQQNRLLFAGDIRNDRFRQCAIAAGDGLRAAMQINMASKTHSPLRKAESL